MTNNAVQMRNEEIKSDRRGIAGALALASSICIVIAVAADRYGDSWEQVSRDNSTVSAGEEYIQDHSNDTAFAQTSARIANDIRNGAVVGAAASGIGSAGFIVSLLRRRRP